MSERTDAQWVQWLREQPTVEQGIEVLRAYAKEREAAVWTEATREATNFLGWFPNKPERILTALEARAAAAREGT